MAVSARELMLILRARDEASKVLRGAAGSITHMGKESQQAAQKHMAQGQALLTMGAGVAFAGAVGVKWFNDATDAAVGYNQKAALTLTQVDKMGVGLSTIKDIGMDVARTIPVPFDEIQSGLYDIFSSMDVSIPQAKMLLTEFSRAAVAGQTDLQTAGKGTIAILNAWKMKASDVNMVNDVMFKLVQKGVGTYEQFSNAIGRAIPSTVRAGGSIQDLAGMMAFMTRNGLSTAQAATSAARAFDAMSNPATEDHMKKLGLSVRDAKGEFKPMSQVVQELNGKLGDMTAPQRAAAMKALFLGSGGTIQARRFFDLAIPGFAQLNQLTGEVTNSSGAMAGAYDTMFKQPQSQIQLLNNQYKIMQVQIGEKLLPIKMELVKAGMKLLDMWNGLSDGQKKWIAIGLAIVSVLLVLVGIVMVVAGAILMLMGAAALAGIALGALVGTVALIIAAIVALGVIVFLVIKYHKQIWEFVVKTWNAILDFLQKVLGQIVRLIIAQLRGLVQPFISAWNTLNSITRGGANNVVRAMANMAVGARNAVVRGFTSVVNWFRGLPGRIRGAIPNPGSILMNAGARIIQGFINGISSMIGSLRARFSSITNMIPSWKGPADVDKKLLYANGMLTMKGYGDGIEAQLPSIRKKLQGLTARIPHLIGDQGPVVSSPRGPESDGRAQRLIQQYFTINTHEIDPRKHSADLGVMIASKVG
jgi:TP901 family phage tail tape measure protein